MSAWTAIAALLLTRVDKEVEFNVFFDFTLSEAEQVVQQQVLLPVTQASAPPIRLGTSLSYSLPIGQRAAAQLLHSRAHVCVPVSSCFQDNAWGRVSARG